MRLADITKSQIREQQSLDFVKFLSCLSHTNGRKTAAAELFVQKFPDSFGASGMKKLIETGALDMATKAITAIGTSQDPTWAKPLMSIEQWAGGFLSIAHGASVLGRNSDLVQIPFSVRVPTETSPANYAWVSEASPTPTSKLAFSDGLTLSPTKALGIVVLSEEFVQLSNAGTATALRNTLIGG